MSRHLGLQTGASLLGPVFNHTHRHILIPSEHHPNKNSYYEPSPVYLRSTHARHVAKRTGVCRCAARVWSASP
uniref:Uncharacterized protein n=1 Tax=uncultured Vibrionales bacterium HF0010_22E23 TaxID=710999 RepID=E0XRG5_9GAMM|nr:hypothetical protein [uncultured Vibrionales bacterium HF0010_22E23]